MIFQNPSFLWGLLAVAVPVAIHLFNFRRHKTVYFSSIRFLRAVQQETKSQSKLRHLLILLARCIAIVALVIAFAGPVIPGIDAKQSQSREQRIGIYIDNSFSTNAEGAEGQVLEAERKRARSIVQAYGRTASFYVFSNDFTATDEQSLSADRAIEQIGKIHQTSTSRKISEAHLRACDILKKTDIARRGNKQLYVISDFQKSSASIDGFVNDSAVHTSLIPVSGHEANNLYVDSCWFESPIHAPQQAEQLLVKIKNSGSDDYSNVPVRLYLNDSLKTVASATVSARGETILTLSYSNTAWGVLRGRIEIADFPVTFDNEYYFSYRIARQMSVLGIATEQNVVRQHLDALFKNDAYCKAQFVNPDQLVYSDLAKYRLIIVVASRTIAQGMADQLLNYVKAGGSLCVIPDMKGVIADYNDFLSVLSGLQFSDIDSSRQRLKSINYKHPIFNSVFKKVDQSVLLPEVVAHFRIVGQRKSGSMTLLQCENGDDFLLSSIIGKGTIYVFTSGLQSKGENFMSHPLFVASLYNMALLHQDEEALQYVIGRNSVIPVSGIALQNEQILHLQSMHSAFDCIPRMANDPQSGRCRLYVDKNIQDAGHYKVITAKKDSIIAIPAFNYNRIESVLDFYSPTELSDLLQDKGLQYVSVFDKNAELLTESIQKTNNGTALWKMFVLLAILAVFVEGFLLWRKQ